MSEMESDVVRDANGRGPNVLSDKPVSPLADAAALGLPALAEVLTRTQDGLAVVDADRRYVYANPAACQILGYPAEHLRGRDFLGSFQGREHATVLEHLPEQLDDTAAPFTCIMRGPDGAEREIVCLTFAIEMAGSLHCVAVFRDLTVTKAFASTLRGLDWQAGVYVPLSWESRVFGLFGVYLPAGVAGPSEAELAFYTALADQAAVAVTNSRLNSQARQAAALLERARLARELHDSVSQGLFSMTLIFELRPAALAEEGLVAALRKQAAALSAREQVAITVEGPEERLQLEAGIEEHLYRIVSEALHNVVKHAGAGRAAVNVPAESGILRLVVSDDGAGFDPGSERPGHLGLSTMADRAEAIGAELAVSSAPGSWTTVVVSMPHDGWDHGKAAPDAR